LKFCVHAVQQSDGKEFKLTSPCHKAKYSTPIHRMDSHVELENKTKPSTRYP